MQSKKRRFSRTASVLAVLAALALGPGGASSPAAAGVLHYASNSHHGAVNTHHGAVAIHHGGRLHHFGTSVHAGAHHGNIVGHHVSQIIRLTVYHGGRHGYVPGHQPRNHPGLRLSYGHGRHAFGRACHAVSKIGHVGHGRKANIGGTMCYDRHGVSYIVAGSRYIIHYY
ncbi:MAG: hypothetical protein V3U18_06815 [Alphaproteobacteria bacterium]